MPATASGITTEREGAVLIVRIDNPPLNLLTQDVRHALGDVFEEVGRDDSVRAVILASGPKHFCAGADMTEFPLRFEPAIARAHGANGHRMMRALVACRKPVAAAIEGAGLGGGFELALGCDLRVMGRDGKVGLPEIHRGIWPGTGGMALLARLLGEHAARSIVLDGATFDAGAALAGGLCDRIAEEGDALPAALEVAERWAARPGASVGTVKQLMGQPFLERFDAHLARELEAYVACYQTADAREGNVAFFEKREARWSHR